MKNDQKLMKFHQLQLWPTRNRGSSSPMPLGPIVRYPKLREMSEKNGDEPIVEGSGVDEVMKLASWKMLRKVDKFCTSSCSTTSRKTARLVTLPDVIQEGVRRASNGSGRRWKLS